MRRRQLLAALPAAFALTLLPRAPLPAMAAPRASGKIVARQVDHAAPALVGALRRSSGERLEVADAGTTGGETLSLTSPAIAADQLFERVGVHFRAARGSG
ncbi:MAG: hypothetical protein HYX56_06470, partial [Chloroflexi bacterium]|nr:hypothetical protein [Chloroflexota bacterium]